MRRDGFLTVVAAAAALPVRASAQSARGTWTTATPLPTARSEDGVAALGDDLYVIAGYAPAGPNPTVLEVTGHADVDQPLVQRYDVAAARWSDRAPLPRGLNHVAVVAAGGRLYCFGGFERQNRGAVADGLVYDATADRWTPIAPLPAPLGSIAVAELNGAIHLVGGRDERSVTTHTTYDPATNRYAPAKPIPIGRDHMGLVAVGGRLYAIAGRIDDFDHNTSYVDVYDPGTDAWRSGTPMPSARSGMAVALYRGRILAIGGERRGGTFTNNEAYDPASDAWTSLAPLPEGRHGTGAAVIRDRLYLPAGAPLNGGSRQSTTLYVFTLP